MTHGVALWIELFDLQVAKTPQVYKPLESGCTNFKTMKLLFLNLQNWARNFVGYQKKKRGGGRTRVRVILGLASPSLVPC